MILQQNDLTYRRRYIKQSFRQRTDSLIENLKSTFLEAVSRTKLKAKLSPFDRIAVNKKNKEPKQIFEDRIKCGGFSVYKVRFFEVLEIDSFEEHKESLSTIFVDESRYKSEMDKDRIRKNLDRIKDSLDSIQYGGDLFYVKFTDERDADLLDTVQLGYIKTSETYFILTIDVKPSESFNSILSSIIDSNDHKVEDVKYNRLLTILRTGRFVSHSNFSISSIFVAINNLLADLNHQVKIHITNHLKGQFNKNSLLPRIEHYQVENIEKFMRDSLLKRYIGDFRWSFKLDDNKIHVFTPIFQVENDYCIRILKERGHGANENSDNDLTDEDWVESHYLHEALSLPCVLEAILNCHFDDLRKLKRRVYDYIKESGKKGVFKKVKFLKFSQRYVDLKISLARNILTFKRFEEEFSKENLKVFSDDGNLGDFKRDRFRQPDEKENLDSYFEENITWKIENLNKKIGTLEQVFKPIEDLSIYRTNFWLQAVSIFIAFFAFVLTADKIWDILVHVYNWILELVRFS